jgi:hypothetical protein
MDWDQDLVTDFENCALPAERFHHREHIRVAWIYLRRMDYSAAETRMAEAIRKYAKFHGATSKYHNTLTLVWMRLVAAALRKDPGIDDFDCFAGAHPELLDPAAPEIFYSPELLRSEAARSGWVEPDLRKLP